MARQGKKDHRTADITRRQGIRIVKQSFLIVCEGVRTEPEYFKSFRITTATVKAVGQAMNTVSLVNKAISIRNADEKKKRSYDQCWVVFDKDDFPAKDFNQAIQLARKNGFHVAYLVLAALQFVQRTFTQEQLCRDAFQIYRNAVFQERGFRCRNV